MKSEKYDKKYIEGILRNAALDYQDLSLKTLNYISDNVEKLANINEHVKEAIDLDTREAVIFSIMMVILCDMPGRFVLSSCKIEQSQEVIARFFEQTMQYFLELKGFINDNNK